MEVRLSDKGLLTEIVKALVSEPELVQIQESRFPETDTTLLLIRVAAIDIGKVIGRGGRTAESIRCIFMSKASLEGRRVFIEIEEDRDRTRKRSVKNIAA